jgi:hypothetical protein
MKTVPKSFLALTLVLATAGLTRAQVIVEDGSTSTPTGTNVSNFVTATGYDGSRDYTNNNPVPGQTFTSPNVVPGSVASYKIDSVTLQNYGSGLGFQYATYTLGIYSVSGSTLNFLGSENFTYSSADAAAGATPTGDYFTLNLTTPISVAANTVYAFTYTANGGYLGLAGGYPNNNSYSGGSAITATLDYSGGNITGGSITTPNETPYDRTFSVGLETVAVPEPSTYALMLGGLAFLALLVRRKSHKA